MATGSPAAVPATLRIIRQAPPWEWSWVLSDARGEVFAKAKINPGKRGHQMLLERDALSHRMPGPELRDEMTVHLRELLTDELAEALATSSAGTLVVEGRRSSQLALSLPFELLFHTHEPGAIVIRRITPPPRLVVPPRASSERIVTAFALTPDQQYLPLHLEAELLAEHARRSGVALDELFVCFTGEDLLRAVRGSSIVHLAGHGHEGAMHCEWRDAPDSMLTSAHLIDAWRHASPRLVVLGFCESSSERDELRSAQVLGRGEMTLREHELWMSATAPSSSMAVDLAAALPVAVIALRTDADDGQARKFLNAFFDGHLRKGFSVEHAYSRALADCGFHDGVGLPVPILYVGGDTVGGNKVGGDTHPLATAVSVKPSDGPVRCLAPSQRRCLNTFYKATSPLGRAINNAWGCRVTGENAQLRATLLVALLEATELWRAILGVAGASPELGINEVGDTCWEVFNRPIVSSGMSITMTRVDLERWPHAVTMGELLSTRDDVPFSDLQLVGDATCDVPAVVDAVLRSDVAAMAGRLRELTGGRRDNGWDATRELLALLPDAARAHVVAWADARWRIVESLGQVAIDILAAMAIVPEDEQLLAPDQSLLYTVAKQTGVELDQQRATLVALVKSGVLNIGTGLMHSSWSETVSCDLLTERRAWHARSARAAAALAGWQVERELTFLPSLDFIETVSTARLVEVAELCLVSAHPTLPALIDELSKREGGRELAAALSARAGVAKAQLTVGELAAVNEDPHWGEWDLLIEAARFEEAAKLLDEIEARSHTTDHPLRIDVNRLVTRSDDPDTQQLLRDAMTLEARLVAEASPSERGATQVNLLLVTRQAQATALKVMGLHEAAADVLLGHFTETVRAGSEPSACAYAGAHAIKMLCMQGAVDRAREVCDVLVTMVANFEPSSATMLVHTAEVELLVAEGRLVHAGAAADDLIGEIAAWQTPRADQVRAAAAASSAALIGTARAIALAALVDLTGRQRDMLDDDQAPRLARVSQHVTVEEVVESADELAARIPAALEAMGLSASGFRDSARAFAERFKQLSEYSSEVVHLSGRAVRSLTDRAAAQCPLSQRILHVASVIEGKGIVSNSVAQGETPSSYDPIGLAREHARLQDTLKHLLLDAVKTALPLLIDAWHGDREACMVWAGVIADDGEDHGPSQATYALMALARHNVPGAWLALLRVEDLRLTIAICVAIEECCLSEQTDAAPRTVLAQEFTPMAIENWERLFDQCAVYVPSANAMLLALSMFGPPRQLVAALLEAKRRGISLGSLFEVKDDEPVMRRVFELLQQRADAQLVLAEAALEGEPDQSDDALELLQMLSGFEVPELALRAKRVRLMATVQQQRVGIIPEALDELLACLEQGEAEAVERMLALNAATLAALCLGRTDVALRTARALCEHPTVQASLPLRPGAFSLYFHALALDGQSQAAASTLAQAGAELGFSIACAIVLEVPTAFETPLAELLVGVMLPLAKVDEPARNAAPLRSARMGFLERVRDLELWAEVRRATEATLVESV